MRSPQSEGQTVQGRVLNLDTCSPHLLLSLRALNIPCTLCFDAGNELERLIGSRLSSTLNPKP